ncbi:glycosyltransferase family 9 protein [Bacteriovorax sp. Seq25_V]|uniref:glycosyltransferase family 9 protein n=1 Tax=Bacteriovorax sp. Seq25_V TaxID=1201288 RepID=UPI00038A0575|nr:glycosyltransferase family 9 protein [Bacteriovorax sp. Seq25_V]EQC47147.1 heptosyltransferase domain protein [Bacteriovorax sp. Seq25_V]
MHLLIIKTGHSEVFTEHEASSIVSLGDVLRTGFLIDNFPEYQITWQTSHEALPMMEIIFPNVNFILDEGVNFHDFDKIINLEKKHLPYEGNFYGIQNNLTSFKSLDEKVINFSDELHSDEVFEYQLARLLGLKEFKKDIRINLNTKDRNTVDIGFNHQVGKKWPEKAMSPEFWKQLETSLSENYSISWQEGFDDIGEYINWIDSCRMIITLDSLGLHLAKYLGKRVIALFGPTNSSQIDIGNGKKIHQDNKTEIEIINEIKGSL